jgi:hypothetical protein
LQRGWGVDATSYLPVKGPRGSYLVTVSITSKWRRLLHVTPAASTAVVHLRVVKASRNCDIYCFGKHAKHPQAALPNLPAVPTMSKPPTADLPDLRPLPSWGIRVLNTRTKKNGPITSHLAFGATVWIGGHARLDVEGFRHHGSPTMRAYQYFWRNGRVVGRTRVGTMGFAGFNHWHFQQFAQYRLLGATKSLVVRSTKEGFCIAPTDAINLTLPHALMKPSEFGLAGACGSQTALWTQESLPLGWGDTYFQYIPGQAFNVTNLPNGKYYIEIKANPEGLLHETNTHNDISLREVILSGTKGKRTVRVPAVHGIDPENPGPVRVKV